MRYRAHHEHAVLVIVPSHADRQRVNALIRSRLAANGFLTGPVYDTTFLRAKHVSSSQAQHGVNYTVGDILEYHTRDEAHRAGERWEIRACDADRLVLQQGSRHCTVSLKRQTVPWSVYQCQPCTLQVGDTLRWTKNQVIDKQVLVNGHTVKGDCH